VSIPAEQCTPYPSKAKRRQSRSSARNAATGGALHQRQGDRSSGEDDAAVHARPPLSGGGRWTRNSATARYLGVSNMCLWRWKRDARLAFPDAAVINGVEYNDLDAVDKWIRSRVVSRFAKKAAA
jgi:hypothetical protein